MTPAEQRESNRLCLLVMVLGAVALLAVWLNSEANTRPWMLVYGDSIVDGYGVPEPWPALLRAQADAKSGRALVDDPGAAARIASTRPTVAWIAIGTNDYGKSKASPEDFGEAYARLVDQLHAASPGTEIYAQTPLVRSNSGPNKLGAYLWEYRSAIATVCRERPWLTCVNGEKILTLADMPDGLHPGAGAQRRYAEFVRMEMIP